MRFRFLALFGSLAALAAAADALPPELAALERRIAAAPAAERCALLTDFADRFEAVDPQRGIAPAREAVALATSPREKLAAEAVLASLLRYQTDYAAARDLARSGLDRATALGDERLRARFCYELGRILWNLAEHAEALKLYHEAIRIGEQQGDARLLAGAHLGACVIWSEFDEAEQAQAHLEPARKYAEQVGDAQRLADYYRTLGNRRADAHDPAGSRAAHERSRDLSARAGQLRGFADAQHNLGYLAETEGKLEEARTLVAEALAIYERLGLKRYLANVYRSLGRVLVKQKRYPEGLDYLERALALAQGFGGRVAVANSYRQLAFAHEAAGHAELAAEYKRKLDAENEVIFGERSRQKIALLDAQFKVERSQHQLELLRRDQALKDAELQRARVIRYGLLALVILGTIAAAAVVSRQRLKLAAERRVHEETRAARHAAEEADRLKTRLLGIASHDLESPLASFIGCAAEIEREPGNAALAAELARLMRRQGEQTLALVHDLLDLSALEGGSLKLSLASCDVAALARERAAFHQPAAQAKSQTLTTSSPADAPVSISADAARLAQVFDNLIGNAIKFTPPGQPIHVSVECRGERASVRVRDSGPGLRPEDFARLFQPFQTLSAQPTGGEASSGLGLFIAHEIAALHGGTLGVDSRPGEGATFFVDLPLEVAAGGENPANRERSLGVGDQLSNASS